MGLENRHPETPALRGIGGPGRGLGSAAEGTPRGPQGPHTHPLPQKQGQMRLCMGSIHRHTAGAPHRDPMKHLRVGVATGLPETGGNGTPPLGLGTKRTLGTTTKLMDFLQCAFTKAVGTSAVWPSGVGIEAQVWLGIRFTSPTLRGLHGPH